MERFGRIALKTILWIIASVIFLVLLVFILIQVPAVQNFAKDKAVTFLQNKIHTKVQIGHITLGLPKLLVLENVYFEDQRRDTLLAGQKLKVDISMLKLLNHQVEINEIDLQGITANIYRNKDSVFNFDYILKAFTSEQKKPVKPTDTTSTMKFSMDKIVLDKINIKYTDLTTGNDVRFLLGHFDTRIKTFDMDKMKFSIPKITLTDVDTRIRETPAGSSIGKAAAVDTTTKPINLTLDLGTIDVARINVDYATNEMKTRLNLGKFVMEVNKLDLKKQSVDLKSIELSDTKAALELAKPQTVKKAIVKTAKKIDTLVAKPTVNRGWAVNLGRFILDNDDIAYDNNITAPLRRGLDNNHMHIRNLKFDLQDLKYNPDSVSGKLNDFAFNEKSGLALKEFHTAFFYGPTHAYLNDLYLETPNSVLQKQVQISYPSISALSNNLASLHINANLDGSRLGLRDVLIAMPSMASMPPFNKDPNAVFRINGHVIGQMNNLDIPNLDIAGLSDTRIAASARLYGLPDMKKAHFDVNIKQVRTSRRDIYAMVPAKMIPASISIPEYLDLTGNFKGDMNNFNTRMNLRSSYGAVDMTATMKNMNLKNRAVYTASIKTNNFNAGALIKQPQNVGRLTLSTTIAGAGLDPKTASIHVKGNVASAQIKGYNYRNLTLNATSSNGNYTAVARMKDPGASFSLNGKANMNKKYPSVNATLMVDSIDLQKLHFSTTPMAFHGKIVANVPTADPDYLNAKILATSLIINNGKERMQIDTVSLISTANADSSSLRLKTPFMYAHLGGKYKLTQLGAALQDDIDKYFNTSMASAKPVSRAVKYAPENVHFDLRIVKTPLLTQFVPSLTQMSPILINGHFNNQTGDLVVNGTIPRVVYGTNSINNAKLNINTSNNALNYSLNVDNIRSGSSINLLHTSLTGYAQNNKLNLALQVNDASNKPRYRIAGVFDAMPNEYRFSFLQNGLMLDYLQWAVNPGNELEFGGKGIMARNFTISNNNQMLSVNSNPPRYNAPLTVNFTNFHIETLTKIAQQDSLQVGGVINGNAVVRNFETSPVFTSALNITDFNFKGDTVGNVALKVNNQTANAYAADVAITGKGNQVNLTGVYYTTPESRFDLNLNIVNLRMKSVEGFSFGAIKEAKGNLTGQLRITGTTSAPSIRGDINFNQVGFNVSMLNSYFNMPNESITFDNQGIRFNDFTLVDSTGNKAIVTGAVYTTDYTNFKFGIDINTDNFRLVNSTQADNKLFYGKLYVNSQIHIRGDMTKPVVDGVIMVNDKTDLTIVLPTADPSVEDRKGVVEFIHANEPKLDSVLLAKQLDSLRKSEVTGMDVAMTVNINKNANFNIVVDSRNGDVVHIRGGAHLNGGIDPSGKINLTGTYTVTDGSYDLAYATVKRTFKFKPGSTIEWTGDPTSAYINLTAVYVANVPPIDLVDDQISGTESNKTIYKQRLPFHVNLNLRNELMKPNITFDIILPDSNYTVSPNVIENVDTRLAQIRQDPNEMNKQVLGVLVLGHFIGDNPLQSQGGGGGVSEAVRSSVSNLLSDQLNQLAGNLIAGVNMSFNLTSGQDYSTGVAQNRTDLNVGLSKQFLNDRLTVTVGNNFNLEGQSQPGQKTTDIAGNLGLNYKLTKDGRYLINAYRRDQYIVLQGEVVETGVGFTMTVEYNHFKEIFAKMNKHEKELQKQYKQKEKEKKKEDKLEKQQADKEQEEKDRDSTTVHTT